MHGKLTVRISGDCQELNLDLRTKPVDGSMAYLSNRQMLVKNESHELNSVPQTGE